jgi:hypothetical protein
MFAAATGAMKSGGRGRRLGDTDQHGILPDPLDLARDGASGISLADGDASAQTISASDSMRVTHVTGDARNLGLIPSGQHFSRAVPCSPSERHGAAGSALAVDMTCFERSQRYRERARSVSAKRADARSLGCHLTGLTNLIDDCSFSPVWPQETNMAGC